MEDDISLSNPSSSSILPIYSLTYPPYLPTYLPIYLPRRRASLPNTLDLVQLESAFTIADTRGQGELTDEVGR